MKKFCAVLTALLFLIVAVLPTYAWGGDGHRAVGKIAALRVQPKNDK